ncbi:MAG TPA: agmatine deiminase family protein [Allosphingosinicella sp.]|jgi:agmatine deiminase
MTLRQPPEWAAHEWVWIGFPSHEELWGDHFSAAQEEVAAFAAAVHAGGAGEEVRLLAADPEAARRAGALAPLATIIEAPFGDIWLRDTGPVLVDGATGRSARKFRFNGWGGKYVYEGDDRIGMRLAAEAGFETSNCDWVLEGGAIDGDGTGLAVTTEQCLLNPNRNPGMSRREIEARLAADLGIERLLWLGDGLLGDHTDGHVDNLARFVAQGVLALPVPASPDDPNHAVYEDALRRAEAFGVDMAPVPSPGRVLQSGEIVPASYMNFYVGNAAVVVPIYGAANDEAAVEAIGNLFPDRTAVGLRADHVLTGGGSFHCISREVPL